MHLQGEDGDDLESRQLLFEEDRKLKAMGDEVQHNTSFSRVDVWIFLLSAMCGSGILVQPFVFMQSGLALTVIIYVIVACIVWLSVYIMIQSAEKLEIYNFSDVCKAVLGQSGKYIGKDKKWHNGKYLFTIDFAHPEPNILDTDHSEIPHEHKCAHIIALDDGNFAAQPNNRCIWDLPSFTVKDNIPDWKVQTNEWNVEDTGKWKTEDTDNFFYEIEEKKDV